jgi:hypothetical protein
MFNPESLVPPMSVSMGCSAGMNAQLRTKRARCRRRTARIAHIGSMCCITTRQTKGRSNSQRLQLRRCLQIPENGGVSYTNQIGPSRALPPPHTNADTHHHTHLASAAVGTTLFHGQFYQTQRSVHVNKELCMFTIVQSRRCLGVRYKWSWGYVHENLV